MDITTLNLLTNMVLIIILLIFVIGMYRSKKPVVKFYCEKHNRPRKAHPSDSGYDVYANSITDDGNVLTIGTGVRAEVPEGYEIQARSRSSIYKHGLILCNGVGTIDEAYTGEIKFMFYQYDKRKPNYAIGDRIGQLVIVKKSEESVEYPSGEPTLRERKGGFGSTGKR